MDLFEVFVGVEGRVLQVLSTFFFKNTWQIYGRFNGLVDYVFNQQTRVSMLKKQRAVKKYIKVCYIERASKHA